MFGTSRRHRPPTQPLTKETANPSAATAAASAFARREPSISLSSAAAAAALRARPTTPTNVAQVQSKRAMRRSASISSVGSRDHGGTELHRVPSSGSMSDRTFRSRSPSPSAARAAATAPNSHDVPPVPTIPKKDQYKSDMASPGHRRVMSLQTQPLRTASQKMKDGQGTWFGAAVAGDLSNVRRSDAVLESKHSSEIRPSSPNSSINFSYPRAKSDAGSVSSDHTLVYDANSRRMVPRSELLMLEQGTKEVIEKTAKKKRKQNVTRSGSHLSKGTMSRIKGTAVESPVQEHAIPKPAKKSEETVQIAKEAQVKQPVQPPTPEPMIEKQHEAPEEHGEELDPDLDSEPLSDSDDDESIEAVRPTSHEVTIPAPKTSIRGSPVGKRPSVVHELPDLEDQYAQNDQMRHQDNYSVSTSTHVSAKPSTPVPIETDTPAEPKTEPFQNQPQSQFHAQVQAQTTIETPTDIIRQVRVQSESPARTPHFAPTTDQLVIKHEPPPRSLSPRKSALKHRSPTRTASPSEDGSEASGALMGPAGRDEAAIARKKSVRVSFDDHSTVVVGESAEPSEPDLDKLPSPQGKKAWHSIIGRHKRDSVSLDDDEKMGPRPILPSFGSIREKKNRELEERPLVRPSERAWSSPLAPTASLQPASSQNPPQENGVSSDTAIGVVLAQEQASRNAANISKFREPLPPVVTSVDSDGHLSISDLSSDDSDAELSVVEQATPETETNEMEQTTNTPAIATEAPTEENVPTISISQPSPHGLDADRSDSPQDFFDLPGGFPGDESKSESDGTQTLPVDNAEKISTSETEGSEKEKGPSQSEPNPVQRASESVIATPPSPLIHDIQEEEESSDGNSIYSDAYEDLSDVDGDGFMSLDAIVERPVDKVSQKLLEKTVAKSKEANANSDMAATEDGTKDSKDTKDEWESAKAYWKSLSAEKRRQLEREAMEEAGEDADLEEATPPPKQKKKKRRSMDKPLEPIISNKVLHPERVYQIQPGTPWPTPGATESPTEAQKRTASGGMKLKKSMRQGGAPQQAKLAHTGKMRKSMRAGAAPQNPQDGHLRKSLRATPEAATASGPGAMTRTTLRPNGSALSEAQRPMSYPPPVSESVTKLRRNRSPNRASSTMSASPSTKPTPRRRASDSSESSFRRARVGSSEGFAFRKTMRGSLRDSSGPPSDGGKGSGRFSLRSLSPTGSGFRNSGAISPTPGAMGSRMRHSLRGDSGDRSASMRMPGFGRSANKKGKKPRGGSRFADSSDEDDAHPTFRSRFADSSDDDGVPSSKVKAGSLPSTMQHTSNSAAAAAMGVPPAHQEEDSPDLLDSDDEIDQAQGAPPRSSITISESKPSLNRSGSGHERMGGAQSPNALAAGNPRTGHTRRGSFMSILRRKKDGVGKISRPLSESAARRDTRLERSTEELAAVRNTASGRLHKRSPNWPLENGTALTQDDAYGENESHDTYVNDEKRPSTASGATLASPTSPVKQAFLKRRSTSQGPLGQAQDREVHVAAPIESGNNTGTGCDAPESQKKKKFGSLRKMFGLHD